MSIAFALWNVVNLTADDCCVLIMVEEEET